MSVAQAHLKLCVPVGDTGLRPSEAPIMCLPWGCALFTVPQPLSAVPVCEGTVV